jgi:EAL domain-containing protein (putative c-di-GMP-specific phosphodiesterase class I)
MGGDGQRWSRFIGWVARWDACVDQSDVSSVISVSRARSFVLPSTIGGLIDQQAVTSVYQPLVDLYDGETVGYEALARGPAGSSLERPDALFAAAHAAGKETEVEWECQRAALTGALRAGLAPGQALFVNFEPRVLTVARPEWLALLTDAALGKFAVFAEVTERSLTDRPAELLAAVEGLRGLGVGIALDDVGADPRSLALMPFLAPDVIKLDLRLVQENPSRQIAEIVHAVGAEAERTGALVLAEGIETEAHRQAALALGARYGQGWLFGRPAAIEPSEQAITDAIPRPQRKPPDHQQTPFEVVTQSRPTRRGSKRLLLALSMQIEAHASSLGASAVVLSGFQESQYFSAATGLRYSALSNGAALVGALGIGLSDEPAPGVRGVALDRVDSLRDEWDVIVIGTHFAMAFVARDLGDKCADMQKRFDFAVTYDRDLAVGAARELMGRLAAR